MAMLPPPWLFIGLMACAAAPPRPSIAALDPAARLSQYAHTAWRVRDGSSAARLAPWPACG